MDVVFFNLDGGLQMCSLEDHSQSCMLIYALFCTYVILQYNNIFKSNMQGGVMQEKKSSPSLIYRSR